MKLSLCHFLITLVKLCSDVSYTALVGLAVTLACLVYLAIESTLLAYLRWSKARQHGRRANHS